MVRLGTSYEVNNTSFSDSQCKAEEFDFVATSKSIHTGVRCSAGPDIGCGSGLSPREAERHPTPSTQRTIKSAVTAPSVGSSAVKAKAIASYGKLPLSFEVNRSCLLQSCFLLARHAAGLNLGFQLLPLVLKAFRVAGLLSSLRPKRGSSAEFQNHLYGNEGPRLHFRSGSFFLTPAQVFCATCLDSTTTRTIKRRTRPGPKLPRRLKTVSA